jgi:hypothetical protein
LSTEPHPIKVANRASSETARADEIVIETTKTGKVTAVVVVMSIFIKKRCKSQSTNLRNEKPSCQKAESLRNFSQKLRKGRIQTKLVSKLKKLELNCTNSELKSKKDTLRLHQQALSKCWLWA